MIQILVLGSPFSRTCHFQEDVEPGEVGIFGDNGAELLLLYGQQFADYVRQFLQEAVFFLANPDTGSITAGANVRVHDGFAKSTFRAKPALPKIGVEYDFRIYARIRR
jgi:hypothetical protein